MKLFFFLPIDIHQKRLDVGSYHVVSTLLYPWKPQRVKVFKDLKEAVVMLQSTFSCREREREHGIVGIVGRWAS